MTARTELHEASALVNHSALVRRVANVLAAFAVLLVLCLTLFPFDFTTSNFQLRFGKLLAPNFAVIDAEGLWDDVLVNILLFVPLGYASAVLMRGSRNGVWKPLLRVCATGFLLSLTIEFLQVFLPFRFPSLFDVAANTIGAGVGFALHRILGGRISRSIVSALENETTATRWLVMTYAVGVIVAVGLVAVLQYALMFSYGDKSFPLTFGNEPTGARPWSGRIEYFMLATEAHTRNEVAVMFQAERLKFDNQSNTIVASYDFRSPQPYANRCIYAANLERKGSGVARLEANGFVTDGSQWLESKQAGVVVTTFVAHSSRFTVLTRLTSSGRQRETNARIMTIAGDPTKQNLSLIQSGDDLVVRFRTMVTGVNGTTPQFVARDVFKDSSVHTLVVTFDRENLHVYIDNVHRVYAARLGPGFAFFSRLSPWNRNFVLSSTAARLYEPAFRVLVFVPFGVLFAIALQYRRRATYDMMILAALALAPLAVEAMLGFQLGRAIDSEYVVLGIGVIALTLVALSLGKLAFRRRPRATSSLSFSSTHVVHEHSA